MKALLGSWTLVSYVTEHPDGTLRRPYGNAIGRLSYDESGRMAGQVMRPGRAPVVKARGGLADVRAAYTGYIAYFGTYRVHEETGTVVHHVEGSLNPSWVGGDQVRKMRFERDLLVLSADVSRPTGNVRHTLTWKKLD